MHVDITFRMIVRLLLNSGGSINTKSRAGNTALHKAAERGFEEIAKLLLERNANMEIENAKGQTAADLVQNNTIAYNTVQYSKVCYITILCEMSRTVEYNNSFA